MSLLPSSDDVSPEQEGEIQVFGVGEDETADVFEALSSESARRILAAIYDDPATPSALGDRLDMSIQNVSYHLDNLHNVGVIRVADTRYSEKGKEMQVYAPADDPLVVFVGTETRKTGFRDLLKRLVGATGLLGVMSAGLFLSRSFGQPAGGGTTGPFAFIEIPGVEFLLGGLFVLLLSLLWWAWVQHR